jgi:hypothetical protein
MRRLITTLTVFVAFAAAPAFAAPIDHVSPDARDSARQLQQATATDLRSPDAREVATNPVATYTPGRVVVSTPKPVVQITDSGFSWGDAGIGAAGTLGLIALVAGGSLVLSHRRRDRHLPIATS